MSDNGSPKSVVSWNLATPNVLAVLIEAPPANPLGLPVIDGLNAALDYAETEAQIKTVVVGSGVAGFFIAGADIKHMSSIDGSAFTAYGEALRALLGRFADSRWVSIAAIDGLALGGGLEFALACTLRVATQASSFGLPEVKLGLIPGGGGTQRLPRFVGRGVALDMILTGRRISAEQALATGLINRLVDPGTAFDHAVDIAGQLCTLSQPALRAVVRAVDVSYDVPLAAGLRREAREEEHLFRKGEANEGIAAFVEKRPPRFV